MSQNTIESSLGIKWKTLATWLEPSRPKQSLVRINTARSPNAGPRSAILYSLMETAKRVDVNPKAYRREATTRAIQNSGTMICNAWSSHHASETLALLAHSR